MKITAITQLDPYRNIDYKNKNNVSFGGKDFVDRKNPLSMRPVFMLSKHQKEFIRMQKDANPKAKEQLKLAMEFARKYPIYKNEKSKTGLISFEHFYLAFLTQLNNFTKDIQNDVTSFETEAKYYTPSNYALGIAADMWKKENVQKPQKVIQEEIAKITKTLEEKSQKGGFVSSLEPDEEIINDFVSIFKFDAEESGSKSYKEIPFDDSVFYRAMVVSSNRNYVKQTRDFYHNLGISMMLETSEKEGLVLPFYDEISKKVLKNLDKNFNAIVTYNSDDKTAPIFLLKSLEALLKSGAVKEELKNIDPKKTKLLIFNDNTNLTNIKKEMEKYKKDKDTHYILVIKSLSKAIHKSSIKDSKGNLALSEEILKPIFASREKNMDLIFLENQDIFYEFISDSYIADLFQEFQNIQIPIMDSTSAKEQLICAKEHIEKAIGTKIEDDALVASVDYFTVDKNSKFNTAIKYLKKVASYFIEEEVLTKEHVQTYWESTKKEDATVKNGPYEINFDTKMSLDNIVGSPMTKKQAELVVYEIKNYPKTKGYVIYNTQGYGGGRLDCAKAIAGEAKIPMVAINASDFAIRDLDTINQNPMDAIEVKIKKLTDTLKAQAKANPNKTAMLFIQNFDNFASNPLYGVSSIYEQQAFSRLIKEMRKAQEDGSYNLVILGASDMPELLNENILRPGLFMDEIAIYPPQTRENIAEIIKKHIKNNNFELAGKTQEENEQIIKHFTNVILGAPEIEIVDILNMANLLSRKNGEKSISIENINEAFLIKTVGMPSEYKMDDRQKGLIIRHEGGHALNLQFMYNLLKEEGDSLRIPDSIANITLDPRSDYLGCVYHQPSEENMVETNLETIFSDMVCSFGGNSSESIFYDMEGSWGISQDLRSANSLAKLAVLNMGLGTNMDYFVPDFNPETGLPELPGGEEQNYIEDVRTFLYNAKYLSDEIVECYSEFLNEFAQKHVQTFGTGNCIVTGFDFAQMLKNWEEVQTSEKKEEIKKLKETAFEIIKAQKNGDKYKFDELQDSDINV